MAIPNLTATVSQDKKLSILDLNELALRSCYFLLSALACWVESCIGTSCPESFREAVKRLKSRIPKHLGYFGKYFIRGNDVVVIF
jgi:hypothetical protein